MGCKRDILHTRERIPRLQRLVGEYIEAGMTDVTAPQPVDECALIDQRTACRIDENHARLHACHMLRTEKSARSVIERKMHRDHVGPHQKSVERNQWLVQTLGAVPCQHFHAETAPNAQNRAADPTYSDHSQGFSTKLLAFER